MRVQLQWDAVHSAAPKSVGTCCPKRYGRRRVTGGWWNGASDGSRGHSRFVDAQVRVEATSAVETVRHVAQAVYFRTALDVCGWYDGPWTKFGRLRLSLSNAPCVAR